MHTLSTTAPLIPTRGRRTLNVPRLSSGDSRNRHVHTVTTSNRRLFTIVASWTKVDERNSATVYKSTYYSSSCRHVTDILKRQRAGKASSEDHLIVSYSFTRMTTDTLFGSLSKFLHS